MTEKKKVARVSPGKVEVVADVEKELRTALVGAETYESVPVDFVRFPPTGPQDLHGKSGATSVSSNRGSAKRSMHTIDFLPGLNQFRIVFYGQGKPLVDMVPIHRVNGWTPFETGKSYTIPGQS